MTHNLVLGIFNNRDDAERAVSELENHGYSASQISIIVKDGVLKKEVTQTTSENVAEGLAEGAATGGIVGGAIGLLVGVGAIAIPGIGALLIGGPIAAVLGATGAAATAVSAATTGALAGGVLGAFVGLGLPEETAQYYDEQLKEGAILLAVSPSDKFTEAQVRSIYTENHAREVHYLA